MKNSKLIFSITVAITITLLWNLQNTNNTIINGNRTISSDLLLTAGHISPGNSPGLITVTGNFTMESGASYKCELKNLTGAGTGHDQIDVSGDVSLDGTLDIVLDGYTPSDNDLFDVIAYDGTLTGTFSSVSGLPAGWQVDYGVITANTVTLYGPSTPLPMELINFNANQKNDNIVLSWKTATEQNNDYFEVEHSSNAREFTSLDRVKAEGMSSYPREYSYLDKNPIYGTNYYRLFQVDMDGKSTRSHIVSVEMDKHDISFYPNPAKKSISFSQPVELLVIYDLNGKEWLRKENIETTVDLSGIRKGTYLIDINNGNSQQKLIIE